MDRKTAKNIHDLVVNYQKHQGSKSLICDTLPPKPLEGFHHWADSRDLEGAFLINNQNGQKIWMLLIEWNINNGFYVVLFPEDKSGPGAEIHKVVNDGDSQLLQWKYSPSKQDGKNPERKKYFEKYFLSCEVIISIPSKTNEVSGFLNELSSLYESRIKADIFDEIKPNFREAFPEGKLKEKLHKQRERNLRLIRIVKQEALKKHGKLECQCCGFDFEFNYGEIGREFIEAHHTKPISELDENGEETKKEDIALVCSNCHRMLHRKRPWLEMNQLKKLTKA